MQCSFSADVSLEKIYFEQSRHERDIGMGRDTNGVSVSSKMKGGEGMCLATKNPRGNDRSGRRPDTNCGEHSGNTRGSSAEWSSERNRRDLSLIGDCLIPLIGWLEERTRRFGATLVSCPIYDRWCPVSMTSNIVADIAGRLIGNEIEQKLLADGLLAHCPQDTRLAIGYA